MANIDSAITEFRDMDDLSSMNSPIHGLHPLTKLIFSVVYILTVVSFDKYDLTGLSVMVLYPLLMFSLSGIAVGTCFRKLKIVLPLVLAVGVLNPLFDRTPMLRLPCTWFPHWISGGFISMGTLMLKGIFCLMASFILVATTSLDAICAALRKVRVPAMLVTLLLLTYRYISVMMNEVSVMTTAYKLRAPGQKGVHYKAWGSFLGQLLLRSVDRAEELYSSMVLRGFCGEFWYADVPHAKVADFVCSLLVPGLMVLCRLVNVAELLGRIMSGV